MARPGQRDELHRRIVAWYLEQDQACRDRFLALREDFRCYPGLTPAGSPDAEPAAPALEPGQPQ